MTVNGPPQAGALLSSSRCIEFLEVFGVPYKFTARGREARLTRLERAGGGAALLWPSATVGLRGAYRLGPAPLFTGLMSDEEADGLLNATSLGWRRELDIVDAGGRVVAAIRRADDGSVFLPFDPDDAAATILREAYLELITPRVSTTTKALGRAAYYRLRPLLPRRVQLAFRRRFARVQDRAAFPRWPVETALHDLYDLLLRFVDEIAGGPLPRLANWPDGKSWALVLTHDVETAAGYDRIQAVLDAEKRHGFQSAWFFVPERDYRVEDAQVARLAEQGCEVGVHGLRHDGRDLSPDELPRRLPAMHAWAERWGANGFRAPATHRQWQLMPRLGFDYDSSFSDVARYEPQAGGSCSWLPFFIDDLVELPITLPMDHTLFEVLGHADGSAWHEKAAFLRGRGGMALLLTHPDYLDDGRLREYGRFLEHFAGDKTAWRALPSEVSGWWRRRAASRIVLGTTGWMVEGPAAHEARIEFGTPVKLDTVAFGERQAAYR
jgi:peptidoglycan/xylan/chitin deacetylase (PgdA/CDA1 family)